MGADDGPLEPEVTDTLLDEEEVLDDVTAIYAENRPARLGKQLHKNFVTGGLTHLPGGVAFLDASRTWLSYWMLHSLDLLGGLNTTPPPPIPTDSQTVAFLRSCFTEVSEGCGSFGGGPMQMPHLAPTYSATLALVNVGTPEAFALLSEKKAMIRAWFKTLKQRDGSVVMHEGGEVDARGCYCMLLVAVLLGIDDEEVTSGVAEFVARCQTYEGGFGCKPGEEAHGGFTFCSTASLALVRRLDLINLPKLRKWLASRQNGKGLGFNGRTNKLIDSCYSFWVGAAHAIVAAERASRSSRDRCSAAGAPLPPGTLPSIDHIATMADVLALDQVAYLDMDALPEALLQRLAVAPYGEEVGAAGADAGQEGVKGAETAEGGAQQAAHLDAASDWVECDGGALSFSQEKLQKYLLHCCQATTGGMIDKPGMRPDYYHTCYALSGLSLSQNLGKAYHMARLGRSSPLSGTPDPAPAASTLPAGAKALLLQALDAAGPEVDPVFLYDDAKNVLRYINPIFNLRRERVVSALRHFRGSSVLPAERSTSPA